MPSHTDPMLREGTFAGQTIVITGGGTGLGRSMGRYLLTLGANLVICGRRAEVVAQTATELQQETGGQTLAVPCDVRLSDDVERLFAAAYERFGAVQGLVNNAAGNFISPTEALSPRGFDAIAGIVFHGSFYVTQAIGKRWVAQAKAGEWQAGQPYRSVMSIITTWVDNGSPYVVPSAMSKAGIDIMSKSLAVEWARFGIRLNTVGPGEIPTEGMSKRLNPGEQPGQRSIEHNPMARPGQMNELQNLAAFLMAPGQCDWLTGQSIMMDGGSALATGGNFYALRSWSDDDWRQARERIEAQNAKDRAAR